MSFWESKLVGIWVVERVNMYVESEHVWISQRVSMYELLRE